jgi:hypothetical protein
MSEAMRAQVFAPSSEPAKIAFFLVSRTGRMALLREWWKTTIGGSLPPQPRWSRSTAQS